MSRLVLRILTAVWALWFGVVLAEPAALDPCPMHSVHVDHGMSMPGTATGHSGGSKHGTPAPHTCTCLGACCGAPTVAVPQAAVAQLAAVVVAFAVAAPRATTDVAPASAALDGHPFAIGPPPLV